MLNVDRNGRIEPIATTPTHGGASPFDAIRQHGADGREFWTARELMKVLGYDNWQNFARVIRRAWTTCEVAGFQPREHFIRRDKSSPMPHGGTREVVDWDLDRYACYLTAMCGDTHKPRVAEAKTYFAVRTRQAERAEEAAQATVPLSAEESLLQSVQLLVEHKRRIQAVEQRLDAVQGAVGELVEGRQKALEHLQAIPTSPVPAPPLSVRDNIRQLVNDFSTATGIEHPLIWRKLYSELYYRFHVNVRQFARRNGYESQLAAAEAMGVLDKLYALASELPLLFRTE